MVREQNIAATSHPMPANESYLEKKAPHAFRREKTAVAANNEFMKSFQE